MGRFRLKYRGSAPPPPQVGGNLVQGSGFSGVTDQPASRGSVSDFGYAQKAMAHWTCIPFQHIDGLWYPGVAAWHVPTSDHYALGHTHWCEYVEFSLDGGPWLAVYTPSANPSTGIVDFHVPVDPSELSAGHHYIRAIAYPWVGAPRVLQGEIVGSLAVPDIGMEFMTGAYTEIVKYADAVNGNDTTGDGTSGNPYQTLYRARTAVRSAAPGNDVSRHRIKLKAGSYAHTATDSVTALAADGWLTIEPAEGVAKADCIINSSGTSNGIRVQKERLRNITITAPADKSVAFKGAIASPGNSTTAKEALWLDNCDYIGPDKDKDCIIYTSQTWNGGIFITGGNYSNMYFGPSTVRIGIGYTVDTYGSDVWHQCRFLVNCVARNTSQTLNAHPDLWQLYRTSGGIENIALYGCVANENLDTQLLFFKDTTGGFKDVAVINCLLAQESETRNGFHSHTLSPLTHFLFASSTFDSNGWNWDGNPVAESAIIDSLFPNDAPATYPNVLRLP